MKKISKFVCNVDPKFKNMKKIINYVSIEKSRKQDAEANVRKRMTLITD